MIHYWKSGRCLIVSPAFTVMYQWLCGVDKGSDGGGLFAR